MSGEGRGDIREESAGNKYLYQYFQTHSIFKKINLIFTLSVGWLNHILLDVLHI